MRRTQGGECGGHRHPADHAVDVLSGNAPDNLGPLELVEQSEANTGVPVDETWATDYGDGDTRQAFADVGRILIARVPGRSNRTHFPKEDFRLTLHVKTTVQPGGKVEFASPELEPGQTVDVVVLHESNAKGRSIMEILSSGPERRLFQTAKR